MEINGIEMVHYKRNLLVQLSTDAQKALSYVYLMLEDIERGGLPIENVYEDTVNGEWQHIVFPETSELTFTNALRHAGFEKCIDVYSEVDMDFRERLYRGEQLDTPSHHTGYTARPKKDTH